MDNEQQDSPLSYSANIAGILTFVVAIVAAVYARLTYLRNSDEEYFRVKTSLSWYKTESTWLAELLKPFSPQHESAHGKQPEHQMHRFVMEDLLNLEQRLLDVVADVEARAAVRDGSWTLVPRGRASSVGVAWLAVRTKAMELVRQRESLTARVQFLQMSMLSSRLRDLEARTKWREMKMDESSRRMESLIEQQRVEIKRLEGLMHDTARRGGHSNSNSNSNSISGRGAAKTSEDDGA
ncbi:hypothetical protein S40288_04257 [Stachybotrys chartarum IBT 40288]|nr:hypothetical protein S40288_04257 [Stachybotrys chartarum IBT 40288]